MREELLGRSAESIVCIIAEVGESGRAGEHDRFVEGVVAVTFWPSVNVRSGLRGVLRRESGESTGGFTERGRDCTAGFVRSVR